MSLRSLTGRFFGFLGRGLDALRVFFGRLFFLLFLVVLLALLFSGPSAVQVPDDGLVILDPKGAIVEQPGLLDAQSLLLGSAEVTATPLRDVLESLRRAAGDPRIRGVVLDLTELTAASPAALETIGAALEQFRASEKALIAHGDYFSQPQYFLASYADTVYLHPMGQLMLPGYGGSQLFFASLLQKLGIKVHIFRVGTHKAAVEPFSLDGMSDLSRAHMQQLVDETLRQLGRIEGERVYSASGSPIGRIDGERLYSASGSLMGRMDGERLYDASGRQIGRADGLRRMQMIVFFYFFM